MKPVAAARQRTVLTDRTLPAVGEMAGSAPIPDGCHSRFGITAERLGITAERLEITAERLEITA